ncbi:MAG: M42 family metallopeptidase [Candidatus Heimdallarchaeota archaeon]|nr:MAG: M42 family metallopeptidase [Candidatus Heimdallarchaeota archaeon]
MDKTELESIKSLQKKLSELIGVSGHEKPVIEFIQSQIEGSVEKIWVDPLGSLLAIKKGDESRDRIMIDAHADEIGFMVSYVEPRGGFLRFVPIGGWDTRILLGQAVKVLANDGKIYHGIIGSKPTHLTTESERKSAVKTSDMYIDIGMSTKEEVESRGIHIGSVGTLYDPFVEFPNNMVRGKAFDDRTGVNVLIHIIKEFAEKPLSDTVLFSFSMGEEIGARGAGPAAFSLDPTMAIAIENTTAADVPGIKESECPAYIGKGPAITVADRSLIAHPLVNQRLIENAKYENIPYHIKKPLFGGTNAGRIHQTRRGIPSSVVSVPCRYIHSPTSLLSLEDIYHTIRLTSAFIRNPAKVFSSP